MVMFSKVLSSIDIKRRLSIPERSIKEKGGEIILKVKDESGLVWTFRCRISSTGNSKPVIKGLKPAGTITFHKEKDPATGAQYRILVMK